MSHAVLLTPAAPAERGNGRAMRAELWRAGLELSFDLEVVVVDGPAADDPRAEVIERLTLPGGAERVRETHPLPSLAGVATARRARELAPKLLAADLVVVFRTYLAPLLDAILAEPARPPILLDVDDIESEFHRGTEDGDRFARLEAHYLPRVDAVVACSDRDAKRLGFRHVAVIPNAVRVPDKPNHASDPEYDLLFVGNLSYEPNVEAVTWFVTEVLPHLPGARAAIVGSHPAPQLRQLAGVTLAANVPDVAPWYANARVAVVPIRHGGGSRIKLIEALAHGLPVVATSQGAAGSPRADGVEIADDPEAFAAACRKLLRTRPVVDRTLVPSIDAVAERIDALARSMVRR